MPDAPSDKAVTGDSPLCDKPRFAFPDIAFPDEHNVFIGFTPARKSKQRTNAPQAENNKFVLRSCSIATTGPACEIKAVGPLVLLKSQMRTVRSAKLRKKWFDKGNSSYFDVF